MIWVILKKEIALNKEKKIKVMKILDIFKYIFYFIDTIIKGWILDFYWITIILVVVISIRETILKSNLKRNVLIWRLNGNWNSI